MKRIDTVTILVFLAMLVVSCTEKPEEIPTLAPIARVPAPPTETPIKPTPSPSPLEVRYEGSVNILVTPKLETVYASSELVSSQNPAFVGLEIATASQLTVLQEVSRIEDDGRVLLIDRQPVSSRETTLVFDSIVEPGIHELLQIWTPQGVFLSDGSAGDFVRLENRDSGQGRIRGQLRSSGSNTLIEAYLIFDLKNHVLSGVIDTSDDVPLEYQPGDIFQTQITYLDGGEIASIETGTILIFDENGELYLEERPLPDGRYQLNYRSDVPDNMDGELGSQFTVDNSNLVPGQHTSFNPLYGYQFRLPETWPAPVQNDGQEFSQDPDSSLTLSVVTESGFAGTTSCEFREEVLEAYGDVRVLYEEAVVVGDINTSWTAYGYESEDGQRTGVFLAIVNEDWGHVIDLEGLSSDEELLLDTARIIVDSLVMRQVNADENPGNWLDVEIDDFILSTGTSFLYSRTEDNWHKFVAKDGYSFIALREVAPSESDIDEMLSLWMSRITGTLPDLAHSELYQVELGDRDWDRIDYAYHSQAGDRRSGFIMAPIDPMMSLVVWGESDRDKMETMERDTFFPMLVDVEIND